MGTEVKSDSSTIKCSMREGVLTIRLNRPDKLNAFTPQMARELVAAFSSASEDDQVGAIVVTGEGTAFCAGMDLSSEGNVFGLDERMKPPCPTFGSVSLIPMSWMAYATPGESHPRDLQNARSQ